MLFFCFALASNLNCTPGTSFEKDGLSLAPDFTLSSLNGQQISLSQYKGKEHVLLVFGATWCPACRNEIPELKEVYNRYKDQAVKLLYIDIQESKEKLSAFADSHSIPYDILLDLTGDVAKRYGVYGIPHLALVDKSGAIYYEGFRPQGGLLPLLEKLVKEQS